MTKNKIIGFLIIGLSIYYLYHFANLFYLYEFTDINFFTMLPNWEIVLNLIIGSIGVITGVKVYKNKITIVKGLSIFVALVLMSELIHLMVNL